jgi:hypothetical protein
MMRIRTGLDRLGSGHRGLVIAAGMALAGTLLFWLIFTPAYLAAVQPGPTQFAGLCGDYRVQVSDLLTGEGLINFRYPPIMALLLAAVYAVGHGLGVPVGLLLGAAILGGTALVTGLLLGLARRLWGPGIGLLVAAGWTLYLPAQYLTTFPASATPFMGFCYGALLILIGLLDGRATSRARWWAALGIGGLLGLAMLTRPIGIGLSAVAALAVLVGARDYAGSVRLGMALLIGVTGAVVVLPWELHMFSQTGHLIPLSTGGLPTLLDGLTDAVDPSEGRAIVLPPDVRVLQEDIYARQYAALDSTGAVIDYLVAQINTRPQAVIKLVAIKAARSWYATDSTRYDTALLLFQIPAVLILLAGLIRVLRWAGRGSVIRRVAWLVVVLVLYFWAMTIAVLSIVRYMIPAIGLLFLLLPGLLPVWWWPVRSR